MDKSIDPDELLAEINRQLPFEQQIQKGDPFYAGIVLNKVALDSYVHSIQKNLDDMVCQLTITSEQQIDKATVIAERILSGAGNQVEKQLDIAAHRWEHRLRKAGEETESTIRQAAWLAWTGGIVIVTSVCVMLGSHLGNILFPLIHHAR